MCLISFLWLNSPSWSPCHVVRGSLALYGYVHHVIIWRREAVFGFLSCARPVMHFFFFGALTSLYKQSPRGASAWLGLSTRGWKAEIGSILRELGVRGQHSFFSPPRLYPGNVSVFWRKREHLLWSRTCMNVPYICLCTFWIRKRWIQAVGTCHAVWWIHTYISDDIRSSLHQKNFFKIELKLNLLPTKHDSDQNTSYQLIDLQVIFNLYFSTNNPTQHHPFNHTFLHRV